MPHGEHIAYAAQCVPKRYGAEIRAKVARAVVLGAAHDLEPGKILPFIKADIGEMLIVLKKNVIVRLKAFGHCGLKGQRLCFIGGEYILKIRNVAHHCPHLWAHVLLGERGSSN